MTRTYWAVLKLADSKGPGKKAIPVFENKDEADKYADGKFKVIPIEHVEKAS